MKTLLTVDFDFFVPERPEWDFGHQESLLYLNVLWGSRFGYIDDMKTDGNEVGFWQAMDIEPTQPVWVSDSHIYAYNLTQGVNRVVLFDAHHDCWHGDSLGVDKTDRSIYCHNWLREWLRKGKKRTALWVRPEWQEACVLPEDMKGRVDVEVWRKGLDLGLGGPVVTHICRSGCWVPPWLDKSFTGFVGDLTSRPCVMQEGDWNPMKERWTEDDFASFRENDRKFQEMRVKCILMNSRNFLNCKVEQGQ